jgi:hypothetical protein
MLASRGRTTKNPIRSIASAVQPAQSHRTLLDCRVCGAPNADRREACFNCGSLLQLSQEVTTRRRELLARCSCCGSLTPVTERLQVGPDSLPARVLYLDLSPNGDSGA